MKKLTLLVSVMLATSKVLAETPEIQEYMPSEWKYMSLYGGNLRQQILDLFLQRKSHLYNCLDNSVFYADSNEYGGIEAIL